MCAALAACARDPAEELCPDVGAGDLVITELRGEQSGGDTWGQWIEVHNATGNAIDLEGARLDLRSIDGGTRLRLLVRRSLSVEAGGYAVLAALPDADLPDHVDYGFGADFDAEFPGAGGVALSACGVEIDEVIFDDGLPVMGSYSLGLDPPTADGNDDPAAWCADTAPGDDTTMLGLPGSPGEPNRPCA